MAERKCYQVERRAPPEKAKYLMRGIPLEEDLSVFARTQVAYLARPTSKNKAIAVLAMRVVLERARPPFTTKLRAGVVREYVQRILDENDFARSLACWRKPGILQNWPMYKDTGLLD